MLMMGTSRTWRQVRQDNRGPNRPAIQEGESASPEDRAYALNEVVNFHKKHLCFGRGAPSLSPTAPINPYAPNQVDESRRASCTTL